MKTKFIISIIFTLLGLSFHSIGQTCSVNAGVPQNICEGDDFILEGNTSGINLDFSTIQWTLISQPAGANAIIDDNTSLITCISGTIIPGNYEFQLSADCTIGTASQNVIYTINAAPTTASFSNANITCYYGGGINLNGVAAGVGETISWGIVSGKGTFSSNNTNNTIFYPEIDDDDCISSSNYHWANIQYTISNANCSSSYDRWIRFRHAEKPFWVVQESGSLCGLCKDLYAACSLDGTGQWTYTGPGNVTFYPDDQTAWGVVACVDEPGGPYTFTWTVTNGCRSGSDNTGPFTFNDTGVGSDVNIDAGPEQKYCGGMPSEIVLDADELPSGYTGTWTQLQGLPTTIIDVNDPNTQVIGLQIGGGPYIFKWGVSGGVGCGVSDTLLVYEIPDWEWEVGGQLCSSSAALSAGGLTLLETSPMETIALYFDTMIIRANIIDFPSQMTQINIAPTFQAIVNPNSGGGWSGSGVTLSGNIGDQLEWNLNRAYIDSGFGGGYPDDYSVGIELNLASYWEIPGHYEIDFEIWDGCEWQYFKYDDYKGWNTQALVNAGTDIEIPCGINTIQLAGNYISHNYSWVANMYNLGYWTYVSGPGTNPIDPSEVHSQNPTLTNLQDGLYTFRYSVDQASVCDVPNVDYVTVLVSSANPTGVTVNINQSEFCAGGPVSLSGTLGNGGSGTWVQTSPNQPTKQATFYPDANSPDVTLMNLSAGDTYSFEWQVSNACGTTSVPVSFLVGTDQGPSLANIDPDTICNSNSNTINLTADAITDGIGTWTYLYGAGGSVSISDPNANITTAINVSTAGAYYFEWRVENSPCGIISRDTLVVSRGTPSSSLHDAGFDEEYCGVTLPFSTSLNANQYIDPSTTYVTYQWVQISGPQPVIFSDIISPTSSVTFSAYGSYKLNWTLSYGGNNCTVVEDLVEIVIGPGTPTSFAGSDQFQCEGTNTFILDALDINPIEGIGIWTVQSSTGPTVTFTDKFDPNTTISLDSGGEIILKWTTFPSIGECSAKEDLTTITYITSANAGTDFEICEGDAALLIGDSPHPNTIVTWTQTAGPAATIISPNNYMTGVSGLVVGNTYTFQYEKNYNSGACITSDLVDVTITSMAETPNAGTDGALCLQWDSREIHLEGNVPSSGVIGTWGLVKRPTGSSLGSFSDINDPFAIYSPADSIGTYIFEWIFEEGDCQKVDLVTYTTTICNRISGYTWYDQNEDGLRQNSETLLDGVEVVLYNDENIEIGRLHTKENGYFEFINMPADDYYIVFDETSNTQGTAFGSPTHYNVNNSSDITDANDSDIDVYNYTTPLFNLRDGYIMPNIDAGFTINVLPVELTYFKGESISCDNILKWETASEENNNYFQIEHSHDGENFDVLDVVEGVGNSVENIQYQYLHQFIRKDINYYRLKQVDFDGTYEYSETITIHSECHGVSDEDFIIYPNPTIDEFSIEMKSLVEGQAEINIIDISGQILKHASIDLNEGITIKRVSLSDYPPGIYMVLLTDSLGREEIFNIIKVDE